MRTHRDVDRSGEDEREAPVQAPLPPSVAQILALQRTAGNAAVARYVDTSTIVPDPDFEELEEDDEDEVVHFEVSETAHYDTPVAQAPSQQTETEAATDNYAVPTLVTPPQQTGAQAAADHYSVPPPLSTPSQQSEPQSATDNYAVPTLVTPPQQTGAQAAADNYSVPPVPSAPPSQQRQRQARAQPRQNPEELARRQREADVARRQFAHDRAVENRERERQAKNYPEGRGPALAPYQRPGPSSEETYHERVVKRVDGEIAALDAKKKKIPNLKAEIAHIDAKQEQLRKSSEESRQAKARLQTIREAPPDRPARFMVKEVDQRNRAYKEEEASSEDFTETLIDLQLRGDMRRLNKDKDAEGNPISDRDGLKLIWGWTEEDCVKYYDVPKEQREARRVKYLWQEEERAIYEIHLGGTLRYGSPPQTMKTDDMMSKVAGSGWGIFVMSEQGKWYAGTHTVGLFHHSSFLAGDVVACAGELKVSNGSLKGISNKSGHYAPTAEMLMQSLGELARAGVNLGGVRADVWYVDQADGNKVKVEYYDAAQFLARGRGNHKKDKADFSV